MFDNSLGIEVFQIVRKQAGSICTADNYDDFVLLPLLLFHIVTTIYLYSFLHGRLVVEEDSAEFKFYNATTEHLPRTDPRDLLGTYILVSSKVYGIVD